MDEQAHQYRLSVSGIDNLQLIMDTPVIFVESGVVADIPVRLRAEESDLEARSNEVIFTLEATDDDRLQIRKDGRFLGPG